MKTLNLMNVKEDDVLDRDDMKNILAGSGGGCYCPGGPCLGSGQLFQDCCNSIYTCYYYKCNDPNCLVEGGSGWQCAQEVSELYTQCVANCMT
jgi:hypothetical protein